MHWLVAALYPNATPPTMSLVQPPGVHTAVLAAPEHRALPGRQLAAVHGVVQNEKAGEVVA